MKISKNSWHYKLMLRSQGEYFMPTDLCEYMRKLTALIIILIVMAGVFCFFGFIAISPILLLGVYLLGITFENGNPLIAPAALAICMYLGTGTVYLIHLYTNRKKKKPSIIKEYYMSKKDKYCTKIEFEE